jgi:putative transcriptional regulator
VANKPKTESIFNSNEDSFWREVVIGLGQRYAHIANFPVDPTMN